jgi:cobalamin biosynthesis Mg chelatase CobN
MGACRHRPTQDHEQEIEQQHEQYQRAGETVTRTETFINATPMLAVGALALIVWVCAAWRGRRRPNRYVRDVLPQPQERCVVKNFPNVQAR